MKKSALITLEFIFLFVTVMLCSAAVRAQPSPPPPKPRPVVQPTPGSAPSPTQQVSISDSGDITGSVYTNSYFGLRLTIPKGWSIQGDEVKREIKERGKSSLRTMDDREKGRFDEAIERTANLLTISKLPLGTPNQFNALFMSIAEAVPLSATVPFYIQQLKSVLEKMTIPIRFGEEGREKFNGVEYHTLTVFLGPPENIARQKYYVIIRKGYALSLVTTIVSESDTEAMNSILRSVTVSTKQ